MHFFAQRLARLSTECDLSSVVGKIRLIPVAVLEENLLLGSAIAYLIVFQSQFISMHKPAVS